MYLFVFVCLFRRLFRCICSGAFVCLFRCVCLVYLFRCLCVFFQVYLFKCLCVFVQVYLFRCVCVFVQVCLFSVFVQASLCVCSGLFVPVSLCVCSGVCSGVFVQVRLCVCSGVLRKQLQWHLQCLTWQDHQDVAARQLTLHAGLHRTWAGCHRHPPQHRWGSCIYIQCTTRMRNVTLVMVIDSWYFATSSQLWRWYWGKGMLLTNLLVML